MQTAEQLLLLERPPQVAAGFDFSVLTPRGWYDDVSGFDKDDGMGGFTPVTADNNSFRRWRDRSGNAKHLVQLTIPGNSPKYKQAFVGGKDAAYINIAEQFGVSMTRTRPETIFLVLKMNDTGGEIIDGAPGGNNGRLFAYASAPFAPLSLYAGSGLAAPAFASGAWKYLTCVLNGAQSKIRVNGVEVAGDIGTDVGTMLTLGSNFGVLMNGYIAALMVCPGVVSAQNIAAAEAGFKAYYGQWS